MSDVIPKCPSCGKELQVAKVKTKIGICEFFYCSNSKCRYAKEVILKK